MAHNATKDAHAASSNSRKNYRRAVKVNARLLVSGGNSFQVDVIDLSAAGFRIETANHIAPESGIYLTLPRMEALRAKVVWNDGEHFGCEFTRPLHSSVFSHLSANFPALTQ